MRAMRILFIVTSYICMAIPALPVRFGN